MTTNAVTRANPKRDLAATLHGYAPKLAAFGVRPEAYIEAALMACVKTPELLKCTPESVALALRQCAQTGLEVGRTAHLLPYGSTCTFVPDYKGLIELACATGKVASIRTRAVYEGEEFSYYEDIGGPVLKHVPRLSGQGGTIIGAYAIADLRFNRFKVEWMTADEIDAVRKAKSKSWKAGALVDWYARKTVVRKLCKTLPSNARLQQALAHDDTEDTVVDADVMPVTAPAVVSGATKGASIAAPPARDEYAIGEPIAETGRPGALEDHHHENPYGLWPAKDGEEAA